ncbi:hypothetical protein HS1genome_0610 [Sulfodiicoccus acidiphilus]|uniref:Uncharacterized protein n=1 Tax=Sulfodiicoccus acidiphilus TaxID=1670455 RepID=A0A348B219_9CREN|nr:hypothetical protein [Sulfodiicoccus acidiphilus]BBD72221.1 hypothetical protein HS1genome_0610 [Sulfodiicoccus acidiphilus]GGU02926.1 hypothetical protein GCM10007116_19930 [Sulfodiicoccus acidiphilus]
MISSARDFEATLAQSKVKMGELLTLTVSLSVLREVPAICQKYGFSMVDGEDVRGGVKVTLERRFEV